jgi:hypothetical protein
MNAAHETDHSSHVAPEERFDQLARPSWRDHLDRARRKVRSGNDRRSDGRRRQFNVTIADRAQLDTLAETMGIPRSAVINLALAKLAEVQEERSDWYTRLCKYACRQMHRTLCTSGFEANPAATLVANVWRGWFPSRQSALRHKREGATCEQIEQEVMQKCQQLCTPTARHEQKEEAWRNYWKRMSRAYERDEYNHWQW